MPIRFCKSNKIVPIKQSAPKIMGCIVCNYVVIFNTTYCICYHCYKKLKDI